MPATKRDYYDVLGVPRTAGEADIKAAYRRLAKEYHPDRNPENRAEAEEKFKELSEAYEVLVDAGKRRTYDAYGHEGVSRQFGPGGFDFGRDFTHSEDLNDIFGDILRGFGGSGGGGIFDLLFGGAPGRSHQRARGGDIRIRLPLTLEEIANSVTREVTFSRFEACPECAGRGGKEFEQCPTCHGQGQVRHRANSLFGQFVQVGACPDCDGRGERVKERCRDCGGTGRQRKPRTLKVRIPAGVSNGNYLPLHNEGHHGPGGCGDVIVEIVEKEHPLFLRRGDDVIVELPVSYPDAALGVKLKVPTLGGEKEIEIPAGTQPGALIRLRGAGVKHLDGGTGDQFVRVVIDVPKRVSREEKSLLKKLSEARGEPPAGPRRPS
jgi:molecular chaperone DnaJ